MVKPRVFVSSTYYDLKYIRNSLKSFIGSFGYEAVLFEDGDILMITKFLWINLAIQKLQDVTC